MRNLLCGLILWTTCAAAQMVEGTVVNTANGIGIPGVQVSISQSGKQVYTLTTDAQGRFIVENVPDGSYTARYSAEGYWPTDRASPQPFETHTSYASPGLAFQVSAAGNGVKLLAHMAPLPRLILHVVDSRGEPVRGARVESSGRGCTMAGTSDTGGKIDVRHRMLLGGCIWSVVPPPDLKPPDPEPDSDRVLRWVRTFYPGVSLPEAASKIKLRPGEVWDIKLKVLAAPVHAVRGVLLNPDGSPAAGVEIALKEDLPFTIKSKLDGTFEFPAVADSEFRLFATVQRAGVELRAEQWIEMRGHDIGGVKLRLSPPFTMSGKVVMETPQGMPAPKPPGIILSPYSGRKNADEDAIIGALGPQFDADGSFSIRNVYPGAYKIYSGLQPPPPPPYYLDAIRVGEADVTMQQVELSGPVPITVVFKSNGGILRGQAENCASGRVWLLPLDASRRERLFLRNVTCDANDRYQMLAVRPGSYSALAISGDGPTPWFAVNFDDQLLKQATSVIVAAGEAASVDLRAITPP